MNNNFYDIPSDWYNDFNNTFVNPLGINNNYISEDNNLTNINTGISRGNMFNNLYIPYKNYKYRELRPNNRREELMYQLLGLNFAITDMNLYLDINPDDKNMLNLYNRYLDEKKRVCDEYEKNYGPITLDGGNIGNVKFNWIDSSWPWEAVK